MADLEQRVETLERELKMVSELIKMESRVNESRWAANFADHDTFKRRLDEIESKLDALPRVIAEMIAKK